MTDSQCQCCGDSSDDDERGTATGSTWVPGDRPLERELPLKLQRALGEFLGRQRVRTLREWVAAVREGTRGGALAVDDLCHVDEPTGHLGRVDDETYQFACFYDAVLLAGLVDEAVEIRTESPAGRTIEARAAPDGSLDVTPDEAVFSFGIAHDAASSAAGESMLEAGYAALCPYVRAFPDRESYERWASTVTAATVAMPLSGATELATALVVDEE